MTTHTAEMGAREPSAPAPERPLRALFRPGTPFNLLLAIDNDDNAPAAIRVTEALATRGAVPSVIRRAARALMNTGRMS
jgi:hypothetical protein